MENIGFSLFIGCCNKSECAHVCESVCTWVCVCIHTHKGCKCLHLTVEMYSVCYFLAVIFQVLWLTGALLSSSWTALIKLNIYPKTKFTHRSELFGGLSVGAGTFSFFFLCLFATVSLLQCYPGYTGITIVSPQIQCRSKPPMILLISLFISWTINRKQINHSSDNILIKCTICNFCA